jgi:hypothetical protein
VLTICRQWVSVVKQCRLPPSTPMLWLLLLQDSVVSFPQGKTFSLPQGTRYHNTCRQWILLSRDDGSSFLMNLFTKATMPLPRVPWYSHYEEPVEVADDIVPDPDMPGMWRYNMDVQEISVITLVVCSHRRNSCCWGFRYNCTVPTGACCMVSERTLWVQVAVTHGLVPTGAPRC